MFTVRPVDSAYRTTSSQCRPHRTPYCSEELNFANYSCQTKRLRTPGDAKVNQSMADHLCSMSCVLLFVLGRRRERRKGYSNMELIFRDVLTRASCRTVSEMKSAATSDWCKCVDCGRSTWRIWRNASHVQQDSYGNPLKWLLWYPACIEWKMSCGSGSLCYSTPRPHSQVQTMMLLESSLLKFWELLIICMQRRNITVVCLKLISTAILQCWNLK